LANARDGWSGSDGDDLEGRKGTGKPTTPIIVMTANDMPEDREKCLEAGMDDYHAKRVKQEDLGATITKWIPS
jgi:two-component system sensor histidine kinase/response regulator